MKQRTNTFSWQKATSGRNDDESTATAVEQPEAPSKEEPQSVAKKVYTGGPVLRKRTFTGSDLVSRSKVADALFPYKKGKEAGRQVVADILNTDWLHAQMVEAGWVQGERGYTPKMMDLLGEFYQQDIWKLLNIMHN